MFAFRLNMVFNTHMDANETSRIISAAGGDVAFARMLGIDGKPGHQQRVNNWKRRGMPPAVVLEHYAVLKKLRSTTADA
jgi:hypothetical protein